MSTQLAAVSEEKNQKYLLRETLDQRRTEELVIALVGPVGSGVTTTAKILQDILHRDYDYDVKYWRVSDIIVETAEGLLGVTRASIPVAGVDRTKQLQQLGNRMRKEFSCDYLAKKCVEKILDLRKNTGGFEASQEDPTLPNVARPLPARRAHIIDAVKHVDEVRLLKQVYGDMFWLVGVLAPEGLRRKRLAAYLKTDNLSLIDDILEHDAHEREDYGQKVRDTFDKADFFIRNDGENDEDLRSTVNRYLEIIFDQNVHTPFRDEEAMYKAQSAAANSACMSRQVGAAIYSADGELIGIGWNDVPKFEGGLYRAEDGKDDHRCYKWKDKTCHNDKNKKDLYEIISGLIDTRDGASKKALEERLSAIFVGRERDKSLLDKIMTTVQEIYSIEKPWSLNEIGQVTRLDRLIEFSRSVHAEMEAIISAARESKGSLKGATMYVTTFPCHSCARHIIAAGICRVVFIEPYPKSLARELHSDALYVFDTEAGGEKQVRFEQYEGVAPKNVIRLFKSGLPRKKDGVSAYKGRDRKTALPVSKVTLDGFATNEILIVGELHKQENDRKARSPREQKTV